FDRNVVDAAGVVTSLAVRFADARKLGQLEGDVLDDVSEVSSFFESRHKAAGSSETAMMIVNSGKQREESVVEAVKTTTLAFEKLAKVQAHQEHWTVTIDIRTVECANAFHFHDGLAFQLHARMQCQFACRED